MSVYNKYLLNLKTNEGPVWVRTHNIHDSQPIVRLITRGNEEVLAPASSLLATSSVLRKVLESGDYLPVQYDTPVIILPDVTVNVANHVVDMVTTGNTSGSDPEVIKEVKDTLEMLLISRNFELIENVNSSVSMSNDVEPANGVSASLNEDEICVKTEEEAEYVIKIEFDDVNNTHDDENETNPTDTSDKSVLHQGRSNAEQDYSVRGPVDSDEHNQLDAESELETMMMFSKNASNKKCGLRKLSRNYSSQRPKGQLDLKVQTSHVAAFGDNGKLKKIKKQNKVLVKMDNKKVVKTLQCNQCEYCARRPGDLTEHKQVKHTDQIYNCENCQFTTRYLGNLNMHRRAEHEGRTFDCNQCSFKSKWNVGLTEHKRAKHTDKIYNCENCQFTTRYLTSLSRHRRAEHEGRTYDCDQCTFKGKFNVRLVIHRQLKHENTFYCCDKCSFKSKAQLNLRRHEKRCPKGDKK